VFQAIIEVEIVVDHLRVARPVRPPTVLRGNLSGADFKALRWTIVIGIRDVPACVSAKSTRCDITVLVVHIVEHFQENQQLSTTPVKRLRAKSSVTVASGPMPRSTEEWLICARHRATFSIAGSRSCAQDAQDL
jgi:hypothetical protein